MTFAEMDSCFIRAIRYLHSVSNESQNNLRIMLDESIKNKYGSGKEIGQFVNFSATFQEYPVLSSGTIGNEIKDDGKAGSSSDNELELDLLKEDLMCVICKGMGVGARNRLVECCDCNSLYHQECHDPTISEEEIESNSFWSCAACREASKAVRKSGSQQMSISSQKVLHQVSTMIIHSNKVYNEKEYCDMNSSKQISSTKSSAGSSNKSSVLQNRVLTPNINIISADKRLQIMKKKAAKLQEKRKLSR